MKLHFESEVEQNEVRKIPTEQTCLVVEEDQETEMEGKGDTPKATVTRKATEIRKGEQEKHKTARQEQERKTRMINSL